MFSIKKNSIFFIIIVMLSSGMGVYADNDVEVVSNQNEQSVEDSFITSKWHKRGMFLLGCVNGFYLPLTYAVALGFNAVDLSHPIMKENLQPFAKGATLGIGCWFAYKIIQWYLELAVLRTVTAVLKNPVINKIIRESDFGVQRQEVAL